MSKRSLPVMMNLSLTALFGMGVAIGGMTAPTAPEIDRDAVNNAKPDNVPTFATAKPAERVGCVAADDTSVTWIASTLLVSDRDGNVSRMAYTDKNVKVIKESGTGKGAIYTIGKCNVR